MIYTPKTIDNYQFVSILVTSAQNRYYFPDLPNLRHVKTTAINAYFANFLAKDRDGISLCPTNYNNAFLTLNINGEEAISKVDLMRFNPIAGNITYWNASGQTPLKDVVIDFSKSYVEFATGIAFPAAPFSFAFGVFYSKI